MTDLLENCPGSAALGEGGSWRTGCRRSQPGGLSPFRGRVASCAPFV